MYSATTIVLGLFQKYEDQFVYLLEFNHVPEQSFRRYTFYGGNDIKNVTGSATLTMSEFAGSIICFDLICKSPHVT